MIKTEVTKGISYLEVPEENLKILCGCPENSIKFIMQKGLTPPVKINGLNLVGGPNAILLNDVTVLNSHFLNFAEFPVLHHQYFQGASFNGTNEKFLLIGNKDKVDNQFEYIRRGLHGLTSKEEILEANVTNEIADRFIALGNYHKGENKSFDIINRKYLSGKTNVKGDLFIERISLNIFEFTYKNESVIIDINFPRFSKGVGLPYTLDHKLIKFDDFSVTTVGDGNGWNPEVPCMGALITAKGKRFLVDSGPGSLDLIRFLGVTPSEMEGLFVTHSHDDHFAGILSLLNSDNKVKFFATSMVIASVLKKFHALLNFEKDELKKYIEFIELKENEWTNIGEMEVKPCYSFHTIETNVFYFRVKNENKEWKTYGHITDIISRKDMNFMLDNDKSGVIKASWANEWFNHYLEKCDLKRIDAGGGVVHGNSNDFKDDESTKIILSHLNHEIDTSESSHFYPPTDFGHNEVLIPARENYIFKHALEILSDLELYYLSAELSEDDIVCVSPGDIVVKKGEKLNYIYLVVSGLVKAKHRGDCKRKYLKGDFLYTFTNEKKSKIDFTATTYVNLVKLDSSKFFKYVKKLNLTKEFLFLRDTCYFSYGFSFKQLLELSKVMKTIKVKKGMKINQMGYDFFFIDEGSADVLSGKETIRTINKNEVFICSLFNKNLQTVATETANIILFNQKDIQSFPAVTWSIFEEMKKMETIVETKLM